MSDTGDMWREYHKRRREERKKWHECPTCAVAYGQGTKVPPGENCRNCGWKAPAHPQGETP